MSADNFSRRDLLKSAAVTVFSAAAVPVFNNAAWGASNTANFDVPQKTPVIGSRKINEKIIGVLPQESIFLL